MTREEYTRLNQTYKTLVTAYRSSDTPAAAIEASVKEMGADDTRYILASVINHYSYDGRISRVNCEYAGAVEHSDAPLMAIHLAHIDQLMTAMREYDQAC